MNTRHATPDKDAIALLPAFERLGLDRITLVSTGEQAHDAFAQLAGASAWGFDTESKPTFRVARCLMGHTYCNSPRWNGPGCFSCTT